MIKRCIRCTLLSQLPYKIKPSILCYLVINTNTIKKTKKLTIPIALPQMRIKTNSVSSVIQESRMIESLKCSTVPDIISSLGKA